MRPPGRLPPNASRRTRTGARRSLRALTGKKVLRGNSIRDTGEPETPQRNLQHYTKLQLPRTRERDRVKVKHGGAIQTGRGRRVEGSPSQCMMATAEVTWLKSGLRILYATGWGYRLTSDIAA